MLKEAVTNFFITCDDYVSTQIKTVQSKQFGRSIFSAQNINAGTILLVEKAFLLGDSDPVLNEQLELKMQLYQKHNLLFTQLVGTSVQDKLDNNCFSVNPCLQHAFADSAQSGVQCIALKAARFNHSCLPNVRRFFIGDVIVIVAASDIPAGEQVFLNYLFDGIGNALELQRQYGFKCGCKFCKSLSPRRTKQIDSLLAKYKAARQRLSRVQLLRVVQDFRDLRRELEVPLELYYFPLIESEMTNNTGKRSSEAIRDALRLDADFNLLPGGYVVDEFLFLLYELESRESFSRYLHYATGGILDYDRYAKLLQRQYTQSESALSSLESKQMRCQNIMRAIQ
ncbi:SET_domain-containing protein [Hexamita inflata]|uniref:SET domain-containing protein n=1 Tax=Hexamita inflata TaxID=28002 RepID=A0AA86P1S3_9EUKA|nr:SET domain-containing protein [Hexamita inflata]